MGYLSDNDEIGKGLDPWRVIAACLFEHDSHAIPNMIDKSGMSVDWRLTGQQDFSHRYRIAAYRPRVQEAYEALGREARLRVVYIVCRELVHEGLGECLDKSLRRIGWCVDSGTLSPVNESVRELFFRVGTQHDAYVEIKRIVRGARKSLRIIDSYLDDTIFALLGGDDIVSSIDLLIGRVPADFLVEAEKFQKQYAVENLEIRQSKEFHDRFIVIDDVECWHVGCSIKDAGNRAFMLSLIEDSRNTAALVQSVNDTWARAARLT